MSETRIRKIAAIDRESIRLYGNYSEKDIPKPIVNEGETYWIFDFGEWKRYVVDSHKWRRGQRFTSIDNPNGPHGSREYRIGLCDSQGNVKCWTSAWDYTFIDAAKGGNLAFSKADMKRLVNDKIFKATENFPKMKDDAIKSAESALQTQISQLQKSLQ